MKVNYAKFQKKLDSRRISRELPYVVSLWASQIWEKWDSVEWKYVPLIMTKS